MTKVWHNMRSHIIYESGGREIINKKELINKLALYDEIEKSINEFLSESQEGILNAFTSHNHTQFLYKERQGEKTQYLSKKNVFLIRNLSQKEYDTKLLKVINQQRKAISAFLDKYNEFAIEDVYARITESKRKYIEAYELPIKEYSKVWLETKKAEKEKIDGQIKWKYNIEDVDKQTSIITENGEIVRSKSEKILADKLLSKGIPYIYEMPTMICGKWIRPDFTVLSIKEKKEYYWEHWGMVDNQEYVKNMVLKKELYQKSDIYPGEKLLETFETSTHVINLNIIDDMIQKYLI